MDLNQIERKIFATILDVKLSVARFLVSLAMNLILAEISSLHSFTPRLSIAL
jgi:hypothetical protein